MGLSKEKFYRGTEGYLGNTKDCKLMFLMREPDCKKGQTARENYFWFKGVVQDKNEKGRAKYYLQKLGRIAALILKENDGGNIEDWVTSLKKAIYININPVTGEGTKSIEYRNALTSFAGGPDIECSISMNGQEYTYPSRWETILNMPDGSTIVTVYDVYTIMFDWLKDNTDSISVSPFHLHIRTKSGLHYMRAFAFVRNGRRISVLETYHPAARGKNDFRWDDISICCKD